MTTPRPTHATGPRRHRFTLLEAVAAGALLGMCLALLHTSVLAVQRLHADLVAQKQAISVLDNVVERLAAQPDYTAEQVQHVLTFEFTRSALAAHAEAQPTCTRKGQSVTLSVTGKRGKPLAQVVIPLQDSSTGVMGYWGIGVLACKTSGGERGSFENVQDDSSAGGLPPLSGDRVSLSSHYPIAPNTPVPRHVAGRL